ncbi:uncharacterized protein YdeI (YjbR/CyaY-like superfamily) [Lewinella marina]|uniref:YdhG-like domain-containing protein n=1 Tax=Neolewinella marina TaxID=438751 RepID=A0A2G0CAX9_9BACT|nr:DUF1801 domain-containing protein [Neolewinella marina]NJB84294.1 uncharacterized protein YdeI (YjbR/CyaY-like superfamily) [Neolewinella marina]PHK97124.1 hypothetical protein CGL56_17360 [Neolewinella marina]
MNPTVDTYFQKTTKWRQAQVQLREICLQCGLTETMKWGKPCYTLDGKNVAILMPFKAYCALMFFKGALLQDPAGLLVQAGENTQAARQLRFTTAEEIAERKDTIVAYLREAIAAERAGKEVKRKATKDYPVPEEFRTALDRDPELKSAFEGLTPGRQRAYLLHFASAKQSKTRTARVEKHIPRILAGLGLDDR